LTCTNISEEDATSNFMAKTQEKIYIMKKEAAYSSKKNCFLHTKIYHNHEEFKP
jgi:hypothetical protein